MNIRASMTRNGQPSDPLRRRALKTRFDPHRMTLIPPHRKRVIYVDQFAISDMMKAVNVHARAHKRVDSFWLTVFELLERVCKLQLAVCPSSPAHRDESLVSRDFTLLKRMYEQLSNTVTFRHHSQIDQMQTDAALVAWLAGRQARHKLDPDLVTNGFVHEWQSRFLVTVDVDYSSRMLAAIRRNRSSLKQELTQWFELCRQRSDKTFDYALAVEHKGCADRLMKAYREWRNLQLEVGIGLQPFTLENVSPSPEAAQMGAVFHVLKNRGLDEQARQSTAHEFLESEQFLGTPVNAISTRLFATIAHAAANHQRHPPDRGIFNDINVVSAYLPYCDAMLVDNRVRAMVQSLPRPYALHYSCRLFSKSNGREFLAYLRSIEQGADPFVLALVRQVYGEDWPKPFLSMYDVER